MNSTTTEILKRFREKYPNTSGVFTSLAARESVKEFILAEIEAARKEERDEVLDGIYRYFEGLVLIPDPQATKEKLIDSLKPTEEACSYCGKKGSKICDDCRK